MAFDGIRSIEWYAHNEVRAYPLTVTADGVSSDGTFTLPNSAVLSLYLHLPWSRDVDPSRFFISQLVNAGGFLELTLSYKPPATAAVTVATSRIVLQASAIPAVRELSPVDGWADVAGSVTFGTSVSLSSLPLGVFTFDFTSTQLEVDCIRPSARNLSGLLVESAEETFELATGTVNLRAGQNIRLRVQETGNQRDIWIDAISGENLNVDCECGDVLTNPVRTINMVQPGINGNIDLIGAKCLNIAATTGVLSLDNPCSTPCCGCEEAEALQEAINLFGPQLNSLANFAPRLASQMDRIEFFVQSTDLSNVCGDDDCEDGLPSSVTTTTTTTTTTAIGTLQIAAIESLEVGSKVAGFAADDLTAATYSIDWLFAVADASPASNPLQGCTVDGCGDITLAAIASASLPTITKPSPTEYHLDFGLAPSGADVPCSSSLYDPSAPYRFARVVSRVYVPSPVYVKLSSTGDTVDGDRITWGFRHREIRDGIDSYDLSLLPVDENHDVVRVSQRDRITAGWCTATNWNAVTNYSSAVMNDASKGYLLLSGWHDVVIDVRRSSKPRGDGYAHVVRLNLQTFAACRAVLPVTRTYKLVLLNQVSSQILNFDLTADVGSVLPATANSNTMATQGVVVTVDPTATTITATAGDVVIVVPLTSIPARAQWNHVSEVNPTPPDNYVIELTALPGCS